MVDWYVAVGPLDGPLVCWSFVRLDPQLVSSLVHQSLPRSIPRLVNLFVRSGLSVPWPIGWRIMLSYD